MIDRDASPSADRGSTALLPVLIALLLLLLSIPAASAGDHLPAPGLPAGGSVAGDLTEDGLAGELTAQVGDGDSLETTLERSAPAVVMISNRVIAIYRGPLMGLSAQERAGRAQARIEAILAEDDPGPVTTREYTEGTAVLIGSQIALGITPADLDPIAGETMEEAVERSVRALERIVADEREMHSFPFLLRATGRTAVATVLFAAFWLFVRRLGVFILGRLTRIQKQLEARLDVLGLQPREFLLRATHWVTTFFIWFSSAMAAYVWLVFSFHQFPYTRPLGERLGDHIIAGFARLASAALRAIPGVITVLFIIVGTYLLARLAHSFFEGVERGRIAVSWLEPYAARPTGRIVVAAIWVGAVIVAYPFIPGSDSSVFQGVSVLLGLLVTIGSTSIFGQVASGFSLMYSQALKQGDYVRVGDMEGEVLSIGFLSTKLLTMQNEEVNLPNSVLVGSMTVNYSRKGDPRVILTTTVTIGYSSPWRQVHRLLLEAADRTPGLLKEPEPFVRQRALSDFYVEYQICAYLEVPRERIPTLSALHANIQDLFNEHGVQIMSPHYLDDPAEKVWVPKERWLGDEGAEPDAGRDTEATPPAGRRSSRRRPARPPTG